MMAASVALFCNKDSKSLKSSTRITLRALLCTLLIILFDVLEQNIQTRGQKLNWDFTTALKRSVFSESLSWLDILEKVFYIILWCDCWMSVMIVLLLFMIVSLKLKVSFSVFLPRHIKWHFPAFRTMQFSKNHSVTLFKSLGKTSFTSFRL